LIIDLGNLFAEGTPASFDIDNVKYFAMEFEATGCRDLPFEYHIEDIRFLTEDAYEELNAEASAESSAKNTRMNVADISNAVGEVMVGAAVHVLDAVIPAVMAQEATPETSISNNELTNLVATVVDSERDLLDRVIAVNKLIKMGVDTKAIAKHLDSEEDADLIKLLQIANTSGGIRSISMKATVTTRGEFNPYTDGLSGYAGSDGYRLKEAVVDVVTGNGQSFQINLDYSREFGKATECFLRGV